MASKRSVQLSPVDELAALLRPACGGLYLVSTGRGEQIALQRRLYGADDEAQVQERWRQALAGIVDAKAVILGMPTDIGASFRRGANLGPQALRTAWLGTDPEWPERAAELGVIDIGDVFCVPQLLHDTMLSEHQVEQSRRALYPDLDPAIAATLPVSPLSIAEHALGLIFTLNPDLKPLVLGGDHSIAWPLSAALARARRDRWGIVQTDAHTDLLAERLGVRYCFATWSYHANDLLGRDGRMVQVGIRASQRDQEHWQSTLGVRQLWAAECLADPGRALDAIFAQLHGCGVESVYFSNDIDGTDARFADATGTPEPKGLEPDFVVALIRRLGTEIGICAGDLVELAPPLGESAKSRKQSVDLGLRYLRETLAAMLGKPVG
ncbi:MAG TPA: arginase family protein [Nannocystis exedens]|nr:arginase family protein [Nannocystis exedens]